MIVPLRSGGGTRLKILEGLSFGVPTVSTSIGAEGLDLVPGEHLLIADEPRTFADARARRPGRRCAPLPPQAAGRQFVEQHYDWRAQASRLHSILRSAIAPTLAGP